jgi:hypothetical protein
MNYFKPTGTTRNKAIAKELANRSAYQIQYVIVVIVNIIFKVSFVSLTPYMTSGLWSY